MSSTPSSAADLLLTGRLLNRGKTSSTSAIERGDDGAPARARLADVLSTFDEGHDTADLQAARAALATS